MLVPRLIPAAALATLVVAAAAPAADAPAPRPVVTLAAGVRPALPLVSGTPLTLSLDIRFASVPEGGNFVLQGGQFLFGRGARVNADLFPSCSVARLQAAHGRLSACPRGSQIGSGYATGTAVAVGITSRAKITVFNGPGGRSLTMNVSVVNPALINETLAHPMTRLHGGGRYTTKVSASLPQDLQSVLDGDIVVSRIALTMGATRTVDGRERGYFEVTRCPRGGSPIHADFRFNQGRTASADFTVGCRAARPAPPAAAGAI